MKPYHQTHHNLKTDGVNSSASKPAICMVEAAGSNLAPEPGPPKSNKRKNHRGGRKTKKKQSLNTGENPHTTPKDVAATSTVEATVPTSAKKQKQMKRKRQRKTAKASTETAIAATDTITERQDVAIRVIKDDCVSPTAQDDTISACHHSADSSTQDLSRCRDVDEATGTVAETSEAISAVEQETMSTGEGASGEITSCGRDGLEAGFGSVYTTAETSQNGVALYELRPVPGKGIGMYTTRPIARGTRLLSQSALMLLGDDEDLFDVPSKFAKLSIEEQTIFLGLAATPLEKSGETQLGILLLQRAFEPEKASELSMDLQTRLLSIFETNSFAAGAGAAVVPTAARMNHSCTPNVYHCWNATTGQLTVHATRDMTAGEEILTCYINVCCYREARQKELDRYGFECDCAACCMQTEFGRKSEKRRQRLCALKGEIVTKCMTSQTGQSEFERGALEAVLQINEILREEGLTNMELTRHYCMAADLNESLGDIEQACEWAKRALELTGVCTGTEHVAYWMNEENLDRLVERRDGVTKILRARI